ncbi:MAG: hypothetical protein JNK85_13630 [Verrucomicrobiales bacterium]|nr:hypothetical protein [Verrucomicrobiales bacterium]
MNRLTRRWALLGLAACLQASASAITNVAPGKLVWLQGYDFSPATPGFLNEGTVKLECVDDALHIQLDVAEPGLENAPGGRLLFQPGAGGSRGFSGHLLNHGEVLVNYSATFSVRGTTVDNQAAFLVNPYAKALFFGPGVGFLQRKGVVDCGEKLEVRDGFFDWQGGDLRGEPIFIRSLFRLAPSITQSFSARMGGEGSTFEGQLLAGQNLRVSGDAAYGPAELTCPAALTVAGTLTLDSIDSPESVDLNVPTGLVIAPGGKVAVERGRGGSRRISGPIEVDGTLEVGAALELLGSHTLVQRGAFAINEFGYCSAQGPVQQRAGTTRISGGTLHVPASFSLEGGSLSGFGTISGALTNAALVDLVQSTRTLIVLGDYAQTPAGTLTLSLASTRSSQNPPPLIVTGTAHFDGVIRLVAPEGANLVTGARHALLSSSAIGGGLERIEVPNLPTGRHWEFRFEGNTLYASVAEGASRPSLRVDVGTDGGPRLTVDEAPPFGFGIEYSTDLSNWIAFQPRIQFQDDTLCLGGLPASLPTASLFFRVARGL